MPVITISREYGSLGGMVAEKTAKALGYHFADKATIKNMLTDFGIDDLDDQYHAIPGFWERVSSEKKERRLALHTMVDNCIRAIAQHGDVVIVGRGGFAVLAGLADVLNVRIQASTAVRALRLLEDPAVGDPDRARDAVPESDRLQGAFIKTVYGLEWDDARSFDLVIDTGKIAPDLAVGLVVTAAKGLRPTAASGGRFAAQLEVDRMLESVVHDVLHCEVAHAG